MNDELFTQLVKYHIKNNLSLVAPYIQDGKASFVEPEDIGFDHAVLPKYKRFLMISNGDTLIERLRQDRVINDKTEPKFDAVEAYELLEEYLNKQRGDGAYVYHKKKKEIGRVREVNNGFNASLDRLLEDLPRDFISYDGSVGAEESGTKTRLARMLPFAHSNNGGKTETYQIKATVHSPLGLGIATHFSQEGMEMFYFEYAPEHAGPFIDKEKGIIGKYCKYAQKEKGLELAEKGLVDFSEGEVIYRPN